MVGRLLSMQYSYYELINWHLEKVHKDCFLASVFLDLKFTELYFFRHFYDVQKAYMSIPEKMQFVNFVFLENNVG